MKKTHPQSPLIRRLLYFWLPVSALLLGMGYLSQIRYNPDKEAQAGLDRLNHWRTQAGLPALAPNAQLQKAAQNHARYLSRDPEGHDETHRSNPSYTGADPQARAVAAGYSAGVAENLTISNFARSGRASTDSLMTALYHRLALLTPTHNEAGAAWVRGKYNAFVVEQGSSHERELCAQADQLAQNRSRYLLTLLCNGDKTSIPLDELPPEHHTPVKFPIGNNIDPSYDGKENPNPMPTRNPVGNPVSIAFYGEQEPITLHRFTLRSNQGEIANPTILTAANDPNHQLQTNEFALFAPKPLDYDTEYTAQFVYSQNGKQHNETWTFRTRKKRHWFE